MAMSLKEIENHEKSYPFVAYSSEPVVCSICNKKVNFYRTQQDDPFKYVCVLCDDQNRHLEK